MSNSIRKSLTMYNKQGRGEVQITSNMLRTFFDGVISQFVKNAMLCQTGLGNTGANQTGASSRGIKLHSTLAVDSEGGHWGWSMCAARLSRPTRPRPCPPRPLRRRNRLTGSWECSVVWGWRCTCPTPNLFTSVTSGIKRIGR